jgi:hypothetical protein
VTVPNAGAANVWAAPGSGGGVTATLTAGTPGSSSVTVTLALSDGATLVDWTLRQREKLTPESEWSEWADVATGITEIEYNVTGLAPDPAQYQFQAIDVVTETSVESNVVRVATAELPPYLSVLEDRTYIIPGGGTMGNRLIPNTESRLLSLHAGEQNLAFSEIEILLLNPHASSYQVTSARIGNMDATQESGFVQIVTDPVTVPAGDGLISQDDYVDSIRPGVLSLGRHAITMGASNGFQLAISLSNNAPGMIWGGYGIGYEDSSTLIPRDLSQSWDLSGAQSAWGVQPCIAVIFYGIVPHVTLPGLGDSWMSGYGDMDQPYPGALGIPKRLATAYAGDGTKILPVNFGRNGATTPVLAERAAWFAETFQPRCMMAQYYSINNDIQSVGNATVESDFVLIETTMAPQPVLPVLIAGNDSGTPGWWAPVKALEDACLVSRPGAINLSAPIIDETDGTILPDLDYVGSHPNDDAYDLMGSGAIAPVQAWCEELAGQAL